ncbi:hypothetical protein Y1Q_0019403 [Alligator mississippiensis]|uniref:Uncharacterized protein n=1 Tax=Alligator mississippiensis TaxID=8496 RepID=A0A151MR42_ALLMI|nr:hypothetical protein Y1Q_0019403 [Alligator mississippiensis]
MRSPVSLAHWPVTRSLQTPPYKFEDPTFGSCAVLGVHGGGKVRGVKASVLISAVLNVLGINGFNTLDCGDNWKKPDSEENQDSRTTFSCWWRNIYGAAICGSYSAASLCPQGLWVKHRAKGQHVLLFSLDFDC